MPSIQEQNPLLDFSMRTLAYGAFSILASKLTKAFSIKDGLMISVFNSATVTAGLQLSKPEENSFEKVLITAASLVLSTFIVTSCKTSLKNRLHLNLSHEAPLNLMFFCVFGELAKVSITVYNRQLQEPPIPSLDSLSLGLQEAIKSTPKFDQYRVSPLARVTDLTVRPANLFFGALGLPTTMPGSGTLFKFLQKPEKVRTAISSHQKTDTIQITAKGKRCFLGRSQVNLDDHFGEGIYHLSYGEIQRMMDSQRIYVSPLLPKAFYLGFKQAMDQDQMVILPAVTLKVQSNDVKYPHIQAFLKRVQVKPADFGFVDDGTMLSFEELSELTLYQIGSMIVKTEDYHCFVGDGYQIADRQVGDQDQLRLVNACGIRGFHQSHRIPGNAHHEIDRRIMKETFKATFESIGDGGYFVVPALGLGVWGGDPDVYWGAFLDAVVESKVNLEQILVNPRHQKVDQYHGQEFGFMLEQYKKDRPENQNLEKVFDLYHLEKDVVLLAKHIKANFPDAVVGLLNASDPDVTLANHTCEYVNNLSHPSTTEENYSAIGSNGLNFENHTQVRQHDKRVIAIQTQEKGHRHPNARKGS